MLQMSVDTFPLHESLVKLMDDNLREPNMSAVRRPTTLAQDNPVVFLISDALETVRTVQRGLAEQRFRTLIAEDKRSLLEQVRSNNPDMILLDLSVSDADGLQICLDLKTSSTTADIPILLLTGADELPEELLRLSTDSIDYVTKPLRMDEILVRLRIHLSLRYRLHSLNLQHNKMEERIRRQTTLLEEEIERRKRYETEKRKLLDVLGSQSDQLRELTNWLVNNLQQQQIGSGGHLTLSARPKFELAFSQVAILQSLVAELPADTEHQLLVSQIGQLQKTMEQLRNILPTMSDAMAAPTADPKEELHPNPFGKLSTREREVLQMVVDGRSNTEIATSLHLSETTVRTHRSRILSKLGLNDTTALIKYAIKHRLTSV